MKKLTSLVLALTLSLTLLTACGPKPASSSAAAESQGSSAAASGAVSPAGKPEQRDLNLFIGYARFREQIEDINKKFAAKMLAEKNIEIKINLEIPDEAQGGNLLKVRVISDDVPDVYTFHALNDLPLFLQAGHVADLSDSHGLVRCWRRPRAASRSIPRCTPSRWRACIGDICTTRTSLKRIISLRRAPTLK